MEIFLPNVALYLPILLCTFFCTYLLGRVFSALAPEFKTDNNPFASVFTSLMLGFVLLVSVFAIIWTRGNSIMLLSAVIFGLYFFVFKNKKDTVSSSKPVFKIEKEEWKCLIYCALICVGVFAFAYWVFFVRVNGAIFPDYPFYANASNNLFFGHIENANYLSQSQAAGFYHWGEIWFNALWSGLFNLNHYYALLLVTYSYLAVLTIIGTVALVKNILPYKNFLCILIGIIMLFFVPVLYLVVPLGAISQHPKYLIIVIFILWYILNITKEKIAIASLAMLLIVPFSTVMAPGCLALLFFSVC